VGASEYVALPRQSYSDVRNSSVGRFTLKTAIPSSNHAFTAIPFRRLTLANSAQFSTPSSKITSRSLYTHIFCEFPGGTTIEQLAAQVAPSTVTANDGRTKRGDSEPATRTIPIVFSHRDVFWLTEIPFVILLESDIPVLMPKYGSVVPTWQI
jgi:hypothetical protein